MKQLEKQMILKPVYIGKLSCGQKNDNKTLSKPRQKPWTKPCWLLQKQQQIIVEHHLPTQTNPHSHMENSIINSNSNKVHHIYNWNDYIIMTKNQLQSMTDAQLYSGTKTKSNHRMFTYAFMFNGLNCIIKNLDNFVLLNLTLKNLKIHWQKHCPKKLCQKNYQL